MTEGFFGGLDLQRMFRSCLVWLTLLLSLIRISVLDFLYVNVYQDFSLLRQLYSIISQMCPFCFFYI
jgi:hypothetical protein